MIGVGGGDIFSVGLGSGGVSIIIVASKAGVGMAGGAHPVGEFFLERFVIFAWCFGELDHVGEEGGMGAREVVGAVPVGDESVGVDEMDEVLEHGVDGVGFTQEGKIGVPVVGLSEAAAGNDVGIGERNEGGVGLLRVLSEEKRIDLVNMGLDVAGKVKVFFDECGKIEGGVKFFFDDFRVN